ncbi:MAG: ECF transporter S component [Anaerolineae bacterium]|nr:ECF transporter S component [Anaerolineae bacterium]MDW8072521.1 ECF transporter S component [Anaerolineae bacterium]
MEATTSTTLNTRRIVIAGVLGAISILLGWTRLGYIPVPNLAANATIMHVPVIIGAVMEGWLVGAIIGLLFGLSSFALATIPLFKNPLVAIVPRIIIGITSYFAYAALKRSNEYLALVVAAIVGTLTNTILVLSLAGLLNYIPWELMPPILVTNALPEVIIAIILVVAVVTAWKRIETGSVQAKM